MKYESILLNLGMFIAFSMFLSSCNEVKETPATEEKEKQAEEVATNASARPTHWDYGTETGPSVWGTLDPVYKLCGSGQSQSPINVVESEVHTDANFTLNYGKTGIHMAFNEHVEELVDNGHTIQLDVDEGSHLEYMGKLFQLKQFHFHTPSEHTMNGEHFPLEVHFVHQDADGNFAVLGVLVKEGVENTNIGNLIGNLPKTKGDTVHVEESSFDINIHLPEQSEAFIYTGSLTTPPCSEDVHWLVLKNHPQMSAEQIEAISSIIGPNNRPVQELHGREIRMSGIDE